MKKILCALLTLIIVVTLSACKNENNDTTKPTFSGIDPVALYVGTSFDPLANVSAIDDVDGDLTSQIQVLYPANYDLSVSGTYTLTYKVNDKSGNEAVATRNVTVNELPDTVKPVISGVSDIEIVVSSTFDPKANITAIDNKDGDLTSQIQVSYPTNYDLSIPGTYTITYRVSDQAGNETVATRVLTVKALPDTDKPVISGANDVEIFVNTTFDPKANITAFDNKDGDLTNQIEVSFPTNYDLSITGTYSIIYKVSDQAGNETVITRILTVKEIPDTEKPVISGANDITVFVGSPFNPTDNVSAFDNKDGDLSNLIQISYPTNYDLSVPGTYTITYQVSDYSNNETLIIRVITVKLLYVNTNEINNGDFLNPIEIKEDWYQLNNWRRWHDSGFNALYRYNEQGQLEIETTNLGTTINQKAIQLQQISINLEQDKTYKFVFEAKSTVARKIEVQFKKDDATIYGRQTFDLTETLTTYEFEFKMNEETNENVQLSINMGNFIQNESNSVITLDNLALQVAISAAPDTIAPQIKGVHDVTTPINSNFNLLDGITVSDDKDYTIRPNNIVITGDFDITKGGEYILTYTLTDASGNTTSVNRKITVNAFEYVDTHGIKNGDFSQSETISNDFANETMWREWHQTGRVATMAINSNGELEINITNLGDTNNVGWQIQLQQVGFKLENGRTYRLEFDAKSSIARQIEVVFKTQSDVSYNSKIIDINETMSHYVYEFTVTKETNESMQLSLNLGRMMNTLPSLITLDNLKLSVLVEVMDTTAPIIYGIDDITLNLGSNFNPLGGVSVSDNKDFLITPQDIVVTGEVNMDVPGSYQLVYTLIDKAGNETRVNRIITVEDFPEVDFSKDLKILAIGNSFSVDSMEYLWNIANDYGIPNIKLGNLYIGGCDLNTHWNNANNNLPNYTYYKNTNGTWTTSNSYSILDGILDEDWDIITIQQASGQSGLVDTYNTDLDNLISYIQQNKTNNDTKIVWNMTWAYQSTSTHSEFINYNNNQMQMYNGIVSAVQSVVLNNDNISLIIPTGTTIQNMRTSYVGDNLNRDGYHLSLDLGRYVAGLTWFKAITGLSIENIQYKPSSVSSDKMPLIKEAVNNAILNPFSVTQSSFTQEPEVDLSKYTMLEYDTVLGFWNATSSKPGDLNVPPANLANQYVSQPTWFTKENLPNGTILIIDSGYQYRINYWSQLNPTVPTTRSNNLTTNKVIIDDSWWQGYNYVAFNIAPVNAGVNLTTKIAETASHFKIYVPKN